VVTRINYKLHLLVDRSKTLIPSYSFTTFRRFEDLTCSPSHSLPSTESRGDRSGIVAGGATFGGKYASSSPLFILLPPKFLLNRAKGVIFPIVFSRFIPKIGFAWTVRAVAFVSIVLIVFSAVTVRAHLPLISGRISPCWLEPVKAIRMVAGCRWLVLTSFFGCDKRNFVAFYRLWVPFCYIGDFCEYPRFSSEAAFYMLSVVNA